MHFSCSVLSRNIAAQLALVLSDNILELYILPQILKTMWLSDFLYCKIHVCPIDSNTTFLFSSLEKISFQFDEYSWTHSLSHKNGRKSPKKIHFLLAWKFCTTSKQLVPVILCSYTLGQVQSNPWKSLLFPCYKLIHVHACRYSHTQHTQNKGDTKRESRCLV